MVGLELASITKEIILIVIFITILIKGLEEVFKDE